MTVFFLVFFNYYKLLLQTISNYYKRPPENLDIYVKNSGTVLVWSYKGIN